MPSPGSRPACSDRSRRSARTSRPSARIYISAAAILRFCFSSPDRTALTSAFALSIATTGSPVLTGTAAGSSCLSANHKVASRPPRLHASYRLPRESLSVTPVASEVVTAG